MCDVNYKSWLTVFWGLEWRRVDLLKHIEGIWLQMLLLILEHMRKVKGQRPEVSGILIFFNVNWFFISRHMVSMW